MTPVISVIIATHSRPHLLPRAVQSAQNAFSGALEILIVDDASRDETAQIAAQLARENGNSRVQIRHLRLELNRGVAGARNFGIENARGEFVSFHDDDDLRFPRSFDAQIAALETAPEAGFAYAPVRFARGETLEETAQIHPPALTMGDIFWDLLSFDQVACLSGVFRRSATEKIGFLDESAPGIDDWDWWIRLSEHFSAVATPETIGVWRMPDPDSGQGSSDLPALYARVQRHANQKILHLPRAAADPKRAKKALQSHLAHLAEVLRRVAYGQIQRGDFRAARHYLRGAIRLEPRGVLRVVMLKLLVRAFILRR